MEHGDEPQSLEDQNSEAKTSFNAERSGEDFLAEINRRDFLVTSAALGVMASLPAFAGEPTPAPPVPQPSRKYSTLKVDLTVNGKDHQLEIDPRETVLDVLRERLELTGSKKGCDHGQCGACTILIDGRRVNSCLCLAAQQQKKKIISIEGLAKGDELHPVQKAFIEHDAFQCGFCTPGQIMAGVALLKEPCGKSDDDVRECMSGNICRCGAYRNIVSALQEVRGHQGEG